MTDQLKAIPFSTGLNEVVSDLNAKASDIRRSLNYSRQAEGGYEWIGGLAKWSGRDITRDLSSITAIEVSLVSTNLGLLSAEQLSSVEFQYLSFVVRQNSVIHFVQKNRSTDMFQKLTYLDTGFQLLDDNPVLTDAEIEQGQDGIFGEPRVLNIQPTGDGDIKLLHENAGFLYAVRDSGSDSIVQRSLPNSGWRTIGTIPGAASDSARWEAYAYTFAGQPPTLFIVNGVTEAWSAEYVAAGDPPLAVIDDGVTQYPTHVIVHQNHLFLSFSGGRILHSNLGDPNNFTALGGAAELSAGDEITGFQILPGDSLGIFCEDRIRILQGTSAADWGLQDYSDEAGAIAGTIQNMPTSIFADKRGITTLASSDAYGSFKDKTLTQQTDPTFQSIRRNAILFSSVNRAKSQYRLINQDGRGLYLTFNGSSLVGIMEIDLGLPITAMGTLRGSNDQVYVASGGWVYQMDYPSALYDHEVEAFIELVDHHYGNPRQKKRFSQVNLDIVGDPRTVLTVANLIDGGQDFYEDNVPVDFNNLSRSGERYREDLLSRYSQRFEGTAYLCGSGVSQSIRITNKSKHAHSIKSAVVHYRSRGQKR